MIYHSTSDEELMAAYQNGDVTAFDVLLGRHKNGVYNFLYRNTGQEENAEEAFQEIFARVIKSAASYKPSAKFSTWLYTIARNYCIDHSRKEKWRQTTSLSEKVGDGDDLKLEDQIADETQNPEKDRNQKNLGELVEEMLSRMNPDQKEVFLMREQSNIAFDEIARIVGATTSTVKSRMRYALAFLRDELKKLGW